ncbi:hypothetical protein I8752_36780 [Nostocaceae cyanobacterium CENA369]|uniref:Uncharacterized protein n=1 Tax=Dendronalium phyllosphericum CENA369 TaxID=1725256 RepID=A0A8J7IQ12_9NOST|nr:hypothetical protein [Dendronalium phyllosphericum]MBH8578397.1 hypothetical protein [Dendronalium phyllosphericum CENA369]
MTPQIDINLSQEVLQRLQTAKHIVNQRVNSLTNSAQQAGQSLKETATTTTDKAINTVTTTFEQAKGSLEQSWQTAEQVKNTTSTAVQSAIASSVNDWLVQHPVLLRLVQILGWAANHPIISLVILLFALALIWSIIKAIIRLIETASWSILQVPLKLIRTLIQAIALSLTKVSSFTIQQITGNKNTDNTSFLLTTNSQEVYQTKQQRLAEISSRLEIIQQEQKELLQEAANLMASDKIHLEIENSKISNS